MDACIAAGLDLERWEGHTEKSYDPKFKARVIARYRLNNLIDTHISDAAQEKAKRDAIRKK